MKRSIALLVMVLVGCASCDREDEDFTPFPGGKFNTETALAFNTSNL